MMSSALSNLRSSSCGSTVMVTDFVNAVWLSTGLCCCLAISASSVLDDGGIVRSITLEGSIILCSMGASTCLEC
jgi:hypothetical protein